MQIKEVLREAAQLVADAEVPDDLRSVAFAKTVDMLTGRSVEVLSPQPKEMSAATAAATPERTGGQLAVIAARLSVDPSTLEWVYDASQDDLRLVVHRSKLPSDKANAMRDVAHLYAAGRQAGGYDEWTSLQRVREQCRDIGVLNDGNFSRDVERLAEDDLIVLRGKGRQREIKVTAHGFEVAGRRVAALAGNDQQST
jgi:hypothetical protein